MEEYHIALSPAFGIRPTDFVASWNEEAEVRANGELVLLRTPARAALSR